VSWGRKLPLVPQCLPSERLLRRPFRAAGTRLFRRPVDNWGPCRVGALVIASAMFAADACGWCPSRLGAIRHLEVELWVYTAYRDCGSGQPTSTGVPNFLSFKAAYRMDPLSSSLGLVMADFSQKRLRRDIHCLAKSSGYACVWRLELGREPLPEPSQRRDS
jgi:hypothetical protein